MQHNFAAILGTIQPSGAPTESAAASGEGVATQGVPSESGAGPCGGGDPVMTFVMMGAMVAAFYFLLIRPQQKKTKEHQNMLGGLTKGDEVVTAGGMIGKITGISDKFVTLEVSEKVRVRVLKTQVLDKFKS